MTERRTRENLRETENEVAYENLRAEDALLMVRNNDVAIVEEEEESSIVQCCSCFCSSGALPVLDRRG